VAVSKDNVTEISTVTKKYIILGNLFSISLNIFRRAGFNKNILTKNELIEPKGKPKLMGRGGGGEGEGRITSYILMCYVGSSYFSGVEIVIFVAF